MATNRTAREWITLGETMQLLSCSDYAVDQLVEAGRVGTLQIPGIRRRKFKAADVEAVLGEAVRPATVVAGAREENRALTAV